MTAGTSDHDVQRRVKPPPRDGVWMIRATPSAVGLNTSLGRTADGVDSSRVIEQRRALAVRPTGVVLGCKPLGELPGPAAPTIDFSRNVVHHVGEIFGLHGELGATQVPNFNESVGHDLVQQYPLLLIWQRVSQCSAP